MRHVLTGCYCYTLIASNLIHRVGQGFWVYGIQGLFKSGIRYNYGSLNAGIRYITLTANY